MLRAFWNCQIRTGTDLDGFFGLLYLPWPFFSLAIGILTLLIALWDVINGKTLLRALLALLAMVISVRAVVISWSPESSKGDRNVFSDCPGK